MLICLILQLSGWHHCFFIGSQVSTGVESWGIVISLSVCLSVCVCVSVCPQAYLWNRWIDLHEIFCADPLWPWLGPPLAALRYAVYFGFMDDVMFGRNGPYGDVWLTSL